MITNEFAEAYAEIDEILGVLPEEYVNKIPSKLREFFGKVKKADYIPHLDQNKPLDEQDLKPKTKTLITVLYRNYWCNDEEREELDKILIENDKKFEAEQREKYNPDNIFKKKDKEEEIKEVEEANLIVYENKLWYQKAFGFITNIFKKLLKK